MALTWEIKTYEVEEGDTSKTRVGFMVKDDSDGAMFAIDKLITTGSKSVDDISKEAYDSCQTEVNTWVNGKSNIGKKFNPSTNKLES